MKPYSQSIGKDFSDELSNTINQTNRPKILNLGSILLFRDQSDVC
jgi:hypothetical protein